jgi:hypothetical protein
LALFEESNEEAKCTNNDNNAIGIGSFIVSQNSDEEFFSESSSSDEIVTEGGSVRTETIDIPRDGKNIADPFELCPEQQNAKEEMR